MLTKEPQQTWVFDRYVNGVLMAEGVEVTRASSLEEAMIIAARLAACGPNGETPVLILCNALDALARAEKAEQERDRIDQWRETAIVERDTYSEERDAAEAERDDLRAELAAAQQREAALVEALRNLVGPDCMYDGRNIIIPAVNHGDAIRLVAEARAVLAQTPTDPGDGWTWNERLGWIGPDGKPAARGGA